MGQDELFWKVEMFQPQVARHDERNSDDSRILITEGDISKPK
jgi:hypothetical protein